MLSNRPGTDAVELSQGGFLLVETDRGEKWHVNGIRVIKVEHVSISKLQFFFIMVFVEAILQEIS